MWQNGAELVLLRLELWWYLLFFTMKTTFLFQVNLLLPASVFFDVIKKLLHSSSSTVRRKAMELLNSKLSQYAGSISEDQVFYP